MKLAVEKFKGAVILKNAHYNPNGHNYWGYVGTVSILDAEEALGFPVKDESSWFARVEGTRSSHNIPGCQIREIIQDDAIEVPDLVENHFLQVP